jgi:hypothetical protein
MKIKIIHLYLFVIIVVLFILICIPFPVGDEIGVYNRVSGLIYCTNVKSCIHEVAHKLDSLSGYPSQSKAFSDSLQIFFIANYSTHEYTDLYYILVTEPGILSWKGFSNNHLEEIYAEIYEYADGLYSSMPEIFREYYDFELGSAIISYYDPILPP